MDTDSIGRRAVRSSRSQWTTSRALLMLLAVLVAGCGRDDGIADTGATSAMPNRPTSSPTAQPSAVPSPLAVAVDRYPGQPPLNPAIDGTLEIDTFATAVGDLVPVSEVPGGLPWRFDTGEPDPSVHPLVGFGSGVLLVVLHGPVIVDGIEWYLLTAAELVIDAPTGWAPIEAPDGSAWIVPATLACPSSPMTAEALGFLQLTDGLPVCYGDAEITITGELSCGVQAYPFVVGPSWMESGRECSFDAPVSVYGLAADLAPGRYAVTGHFDDPEAWTCLPSDVGETSLARLNAILHCRRVFVGTSVEPAELAPGS